MNRSVRNFNPGNIRKTGITWFGQSKIQDDKAFVVFLEARWGFRAMAKIFQQYKLRGVDTVHEVISAWAPSNENDTEAYAAFVAKKLGVDINEKIDLEDPATCIELCLAIAKYEGDTNGFFTRDQAIEGIMPLLDRKTV
jgi:hypothetical protein